MRLAIFLAAFLITSASAIAGAIAIASPHHPQTFAYGEMMSHQLYVPCVNGELVARITFSNLPYVGDDEPRRDESFDFHFPGVQFDFAQRTFFARNGHGELIPVARFRNDIFLDGIDLAPGAKIYLLKRERPRHRHFNGHPLSARRHTLGPDGQQFFTPEYFDRAVRRVLSAGQLRLVSGSIRDVSLDRACACLQVGRNQASVVC